MLSICRSSNPIEAISAENGPTAIALLPHHSLPTSGVFRNEDSGHKAVDGGTTEVAYRPALNVYGGWRGIVEVRHD
jgi:hypothetical protein